jgi:hypothetical protein
MFSSLLDIRFFWETAQNVFKYIETNIMLGGNGDEQ